MSQGEFPQDLAWDVVTALAAAQMSGVDVQAISENDFNADGEIIMTPPSVRTFYAGTGFHSTTDSQRLSYEAVGRFGLLCAAEDHTSSISQARASLKLARQVCRIMAGTRINLPTNEISEPMTLVAIEPVPCEDVGTAYCVFVEVPGLAQFAGANAAGFTATGVTP